MVQHLVGLISAVLGFILAILLVLSIVKIKTVKKFDLQFYILVLSAILLQPVIQFENILYLNNLTGVFKFHISNSLVMVILISGLIGYFGYHIYLLSIEDFPVPPLSVVLVMSGFTLGTIIVSVQIDLSNPSDPISYDPIIGGILFLTTMMLFSIIGVGGFLQSLYVKPFPHIISRITTLDLLGLLGIALTPFIMFILRILPLNIRLPFNVIFVTTTIGFIFHFVQYLKDHSRSGFPLHANLISLIILDIENQTVLSGYTTSDIPETKLHGMAMLAVDNLMKQILGYSSSQDLPRYLGNYGDILFINEDNFMLIASFSGMGKKIGRYVLSRLIQEYIKRMNNSLPIHFKELVEYYIHPYTHKKHELVPIEYYTIENSSKLDT